MRFDVFGFAALSLAIGALQMLLDRGQHNDWLNSTETWVELLLFVIAAAYFIVHTWFTPAQQAFVDFRLLKNGNFLTGLMFIFIVGAVLYAVRALTPPMLQTLMNYPVMSAGLLMAPSGLGTMISMLLVGRLVGKIDARLLLLSGFSITAVSLWFMSGYTLVLSQSDILWPGVIQGFGLGLVFVPLSTVTFSTLEPAMFAQGTALYSLTRNIGSSIGISLVQTLWVRNTQVAHASLAETVTSTNRAIQLSSTAGYDLNTTAGLAALNGEVTRQAAMIAYLDDFKLMLALTLLVLPLLWLIRPSRQKQKLSDEEEAALHAAMD